MSGPLPLHYESRGTPENPTLVLLHGFLGNLRDWAEIAERLADTFHVVSIDLPGHGKSLDIDADITYTMPTTSLSIIRILDRLDIRSFAVAGYSMGARIALHLAATYSARVFAAIIESGTPGIASESERAERRAYDAALSLELEMGSLADVLARWYDRPLFDTFRQHPRFQEQFQRRLANDRPQVARALRQLGTGSQPNLWPLLPDYSVPTLALVGEHDLKFVGLARAMAAQSPAIQAELVPGVGHNIHFEAADAYIRSVRAFLDGVLARSSARIVQQHS